MTELANTMNEMGNPFLEEGAELLVLDSHECFNRVSETISQIKQLAKRSLTGSRRRFSRSEKYPYMSPSSETTYFCSRRGGKVSSKPKKSLSCVKQYCNLFSCLYISSLFRTADMDLFFQHECIIPTIFVGQWTTSSV